LKSNLSDDLRESRELPHDVRSELLRVSARLGSIAGCTYWLSQTGSTNDVAAHLAESGAAEGTTVIAEAQTSGRGRYGRAWYSPAGAGLYVSIVLRPSSDHALTDRANPVGLLTLACGVALVEGIRNATGLPVEIKWPNDVVIGRRKLGGILAEAAAQAGALQFITLGFGVNLSVAAYPAELSSRATSLEAETGRTPDRALILAEVLASIAERYADLRVGRFDAILTAWRRLAPSLPAASVEWDSPGGLLRGRAEGIDAEGALLVRIGDRVERVIAGGIRWL
jgi:BirA family transcriptional regulator, biotin operon repressor / biotin---[acetyl-CoA-carboxylase] ligase